MIVTGGEHQGVVIRHAGDAHRVREPAEVRHVAQGGLVHGVLQHGKAVVKIDAVIVRHVHIERDLAARRDEQVIAARVGMIDVTDKPDPQIELDRVQAGQRVDGANIQRQFDRHVAFPVAFRVGDVVDVLETGAHADLEPHGSEVDVVVGVVHGRSGRRRRNRVSPVEGLPHEFLGG